MNEYKLRTSLVQEVTVDSDWSLPFSESLLVQMVNYYAASNEEELNDMVQPKNMIVRITIETIETKEI